MIMALSIILSRHFKIYNQSYTKKSLHDDYYLFANLYLLKKFTHFCSREKDLKVLPKN